MTVLHLKRKKRNHAFIPASVESEVGPLSSVTWLLKKGLFALSKPAPRACSGTRCMTGRSSLCRGSGFSPPHPSPEVGGLQETVSPGRGRQRRALSSPHLTHPHPAVTTCSPPPPTCAPWGGGGIRLKNDHSTKCQVALNGIIRASSLITSILF